MWDIAFSLFDAVIQTQSKCIFIHCVTTSMCTVYMCFTLTSPSCPCLYVGDPSPDVEWFKDEKKLKQSKKDKRIKIGWDVAEDLNVLHITDVTESDAGSFTAKATNKWGVVVTTVSVIVVPPGAKITKTKSETGETQVVVESVTEVVKEVQEQSVTQGECPEFEVNPEPAVVSAGDQLKLTCKVNGDPTPDIEWFKDDQLINAEKDKRITTDYDGISDMDMLMIDDITEEDAGSYTAKATNKWGVVTSTVNVIVAPAGMKFTMTKSASGETQVTMEEIVEEVKQKTPKKPQGQSPEFEIGPEPTIVPVGETLKLSCKVTGDPSPDVEWLKDDKKIKASKKDKRIKLDWDVTDDINTLIITETTESDAGSYTARATNKWGVVESTVTVIIAPAGVKITKTTTDSGETKVTMEKTTEVVEQTVGTSSNQESSPQFKVKPESTVINEGDALKLQCQTMGDPKPDIEWFKDDKKIKPTKKDKRIAIAWDEAEDMSTLIIEETTETDSGSYTVKAINKWGVVVSTVSVMVAPKGAKIERKGDVIQIIQASESITEEVLEETTEEVSEIPKKKADKHQSPEFEIGPEPTIVPVGETLKLSCKVTGDPSPDVEWLKDDKKIKASKRDKRIKLDWDVTDDINTLIITETTESDAGSYTARATNKWGVVESTVTVIIAPAGVKITKTTTDSGETKVTMEKTTEVVEQTVGTSSNQESSPQFKVKPESTVINEGDALKLQCQTTGDPKPDIEWFKDDKKIKPTKKDKRIAIAWDEAEDMSTLIIEETTETDSGSYTVKATNKWGVVVSTVSVMVAPKGAKIERKGDVIQIIQASEVVVEEDDESDRLLEFDGELPESAQLKWKEQVSDMQTETVKAEKADDIHEQAVKISKFEELTEMVSGDEETVTITKKVVKKKITSKVVDDSCEPEGVEVKGGKKPKKISQAEEVLADMDVETTGDVKGEIQETAEVLEDGTVVTKKVTVTKVTKRSSAKQVGLSDEESVTEMIPDAETEQITSTTTTKQESRAAKSQAQAKVADKPSATSSSSSSSEESSEEDERKVTPKSGEPTFAVSPKPVKVEEGGMIKLTCQAKGWFTWYTHAMEMSNNAKHLSNLTMSLTASNKHAVFIHASLAIGIQTVLVDLNCKLCYRNVITEYVTSSSMALAGLKLKKSINESQSATYLC